MGSKSRLDVWRGFITCKRWNSTSPYPNGTPTVTYPSMAQGHNDLLYSVGHPYHKLGKSTADIGGTFHAVRREYDESANGKRIFTAVSGGNAYVGTQSAFASLVDTSTFPAVPAPNVFFLNSLGATAISRVAPTSPLAGLSTALGELRQGLPSAVGVNGWRDRANVARAAGNEYLNAEFGWIPLINDLKKFSKSFREAEELCARYEANSGKLLHRDYSWPITTSESSSQTNSYPSPVVTATAGGVLYGGSPIGVRTTTTTTRTKRWFSGAFTYYLPPLKIGGDNSRRNAQLHNYLYGSRVTPEVLWNLAPWSWAADWLANVGDVIKNVSLFMNDGLVMPYAYMMEEHSIRKHYSLTQGFAAQFGGVQTFTQTLKTTSKFRTGATPFGFGLLPASFTNRQWSILAGLGLSRSQGSIYRQ